MNATAYFIVRMKPIMGIHYLLANSLTINAKVP